MKNIKLFIREFIKNDLLFHAAQNTFYFVLSIFPFLYILTKIIILIPLPSENVLKSIEILFPKQVIQIIYSSLKSVSHTPPTLNSIPYIFVALWSSSMLIYSLKSVFATFYNQKAPKSKILTRIFSIVLTAVILIVIIFSFIIVLFVNFGINVLTGHYSIEYSPLLLSLMSLVLIIIDIILLYVILPPVRLKLSRAIPGAVISIACLTVFSYGFSYYVSHIADYTRFYGAMGGVIILLLWLYICSAIILSGGMINAKFFQKNNTP